MTSFLFWNLFKQPLVERVVRLVQTHDVDVLMLAECIIDPIEIVNSLRGKVSAAFHLTNSTGVKLRVFTRLPVNSFVEVYENSLDAVTIRRVAVGPEPGILLAVVHLPSRGNWGEADQLLHSTGLVRDLLRTEDEQANHRTIFVGDLNMNPFDAGVVGAQALNAVMTCQLAGREERTVRGDAYRLFYNPMWGFFGDRTPGPPGTYFFHASNPVNHYWNMYDQVLLRPSLMNHLHDLQILTNDGQEELVTQGGLPKKGELSDHLPLLFRLKW